MKTIAIAVIDRLFVVVYGTADPTYPEWGSYLDLVKQHGIDRTMQLIVTDGGEPNPIQRRQLEELLAGRTVPVAVISGSLRVRATVTALSWLNRKIMAFPPAGLSDALGYLEIPPSRTALIVQTILRLTEDLDVGPRWDMGVALAALCRACRRQEHEDCTGRARGVVSRLLGGDPSAGPCLCGCPRAVAQRGERSPSSPSAPGGGA